MGLFGKKWNPQGLHCYITGGSTGLGLSLALILTRKGAHVSIVARDEKKLKSALEELEAARVNPDQKLKSYSFALDSYQASTDALDAACEPFNARAPDALFLCAGSSKPRFFVELTEQEMISGMNGGYWVQAWTALAAAKKMSRQQVKGKIVFVSSVLGLMSLIGYSPYTPAKHALRGLADSLRSELALYGIDVHCFFPATMYTPGYDEENKTKPKITLKIEETDEGLTADQAALALYNGVAKGNTHIAPDLITSLFRVSGRSSTPNNNVFLDTLLCIIAWIGIPIWRWTVDSQIRTHRGEHQAYLRERGLLDDPPAGLDQDGASKKSI